MSKQFRIRWTIVALVAVLMFSSVTAAQAAVFPDVIPLPNGWLPEGIAIGTGYTFYAGSRVDGAIYRGDLQTGQGDVFIAGQAGRVAVGLKYDQSCNLLVVAGGQTGQGYIYDGTTGETLRVYQFSTAPSFINDVVLTNDAAYFTNSSQAELYRVDLSDCGSLPSGFDVIPLTGDWQQVAGFNANGIVADRTGKTLIVVNSTTGNLYRVDTATGVATVIDLGGQGVVTAGDGLALRGQTLYVVRNQFNEIVVIHLNADWSAGEVVGTLTNPNFDTPTTIGFFGSALYAVDARFNTPPTPDTPYQIVRVDINQ
jgi:sugar lactone lactonase YvrE